MHLSEFNVSTNNLNTFDNLSELSQSELTEIYQTGGFFGLFDGESKIDRATLEAVRLKKYDVVEFLVDKDLISSYKSQDENGNTLLHYLALDYDTTSHIIDKILKRRDVKSFINIQNNNGDTPLILSVIASQHDLCEKFINTGADKSIKNNQSLSIETETEPLMVKPLSKHSPSYSWITDSPRQNKNKKIFNPFMDFFKKHSPRNETSDANTFSEMPMTNKTQNVSDSDNLTESSVNTEKFIIEITNKLNNERNTVNKEANLSDDLLRKLMNGGNNVEPQNANTDTEYLLNELQNKMKGGDCNSEMNTNTDMLINTLKTHINNQTGGNCGSETFSNTDNLINTLRNHVAQQDQEGGVRKRKTSNKKKIVGKRSIPAFVDAAIAYDDDEEDQEQPKKYGELARILNNQTGDIIATIIKKIQEIITKNKDEFKDKFSAAVAKGTEDVAKIFKSALWSSVKNDPKKALKSSLDIAVELQKILSKEKLLEVNFKEWEKIIKEHAQEKAKNMEKTQETSTITLSSDSSFSSNEDYSTTSSYEVNTMTISATSN
jgi:hypothetical protein